MASPSIHQDSFYVVYSPYYLVSMCFCLSPRNWKQAFLVSIKQNANSFCYLKILICHRYGYRCLHRQIDI